MMTPRAILAVASVCLTTAHAQDATPSLSPVTIAMAPLGATWPPAERDLTIDGEWLIFLDRVIGNCEKDGAPRRIARIRSDGTGYEVLVNRDELVALDINQSSGVDFDVVRLLVSGDARSVLWGGTEFTLCDPSFFVTNYGLDLATKQAAALDFQGEIVSGEPTMTRDGRVCFTAFDTSNGKTTVYLASNLTLDDAVPIYTGEVIVSVDQKISGDGTKILLVMRWGPPPYEGDVWILDVESGELDRLTEFNDPLTRFADISDDGTKVAAYSVDAGGVFTLDADGSNLTKIVDGLVGSLAISGDGRSIRYGDGFQARVVDLEAGADFLVDATMYADAGNGFIHGRAFSYDGKVTAGKANYLLDPAGIWHRDGPRLTTASYATHGAPLRVDVGGELGSTYFVGMSFVPASIPVGSLGRLTIDPATLDVIALGTIDVPVDNIGSHLLTIPDDLDLSVEADVHFQAYVVPPGGPPRLTNGTTLTLRDYDPLPFGGLDGVYWPNGEFPGWPDSTDTPPFTPEERLAQELLRLPLPEAPHPIRSVGDLTHEQYLAIDILTDPGLRPLFLDTVYPLLVHGYAYDSPEVRAMWQHATPTR